MRYKKRRTFGDIEREWERKNDLPDWAEDELRNQCEQDSADDVHEAAQQEREDKEQFYQGR